MITLCTPKARRVRTPFSRRARELAALLFAIAAGAFVRVHAQESRVEGVVYDSLGGHPSSGAIVQMVDSSAHHSYASLTDVLGQFQIDSVAAGHYIVGAQHAVLDSIGVAAPLVPVDVVPWTHVRLSLVIPSAVRLIAAICGPRAPTDSSGMFVGHAVDEASREPIAGSMVALAWSLYAFTATGSKSETRQLHAKTNSDGWFAFCGLEAGDYAARAQRGVRATGFVDVQITPREVARTSFAIGADGGGASAGGATLAGFVTMLNGGQPVRDAQVNVEGTAIAATTGVDGAFTLTGVPDGTRTLKVRSLGYWPKRITVDLSRTESRSVTVALDTWLRLQEVIVRGKSNTHRRDISGFADRQRQGFGRFLNAEQIEKARPLTVCDLLQRVVGVYMQQGPVGCRVTLRGASGGSSGAIQLCEPTVYLDNAPLEGGVGELSKALPPVQIAGVEVYTAAAQPAQFGGGCGAIVVWTKS